ncbi:MAG: PID-CTERM protein-sorting domain-containing protein [Luteibaculaceae bacterium]
MKLKSFAKYILFTLLFIAWTSGLMAQFGPSPPGGPGDAPPCFPGPCIPIDGGVGFLVAAGVALAGKKLYDKNKEL